MATLHLRADGVGDVGEIEQPLLLRHLRMEHHLQQQVAQFVAQIGPVAAVDRVGDFVGFLDRISRDGREVLLHVPRATPFGIAQAHHDREQVVEAVSG
jgi:hypothetical protein